ncbi:MAG: AAA family ATPase [Paludibacter sp.]
METKSPNTSEALGLLNDIKGQHKDNQIIDSKLISNELDNLNNQFDEMPNEPTAAPESKSTKKVISWKDRLIDLKNDYPETEFLFEFNGLKFFTIGDIIVIKGKPKKGKSHLMVAFVIALLSGTFIGLNKIKLSKLKMLYVDCEMHENYTAQLARKIHYSAGLNTKENSNDLFVLNLKKDAPVERERIIEEAIKELQPDIVFIDGIKDITRTEHNDPVEGKRIGEELKHWTAENNCLIVVAIHENKQDNNSRGAVGASVEEIASEVWRIDRDNEGVFNASQTAFRYHSPIENFCFKMDDKGNLESVDGKPKTNPAEAKQEKMDFLFREAFRDYKSLSFNALQDEVMRVKRCKITAAYNAIMEAMKLQIIIKNLVGMYELSNLTSPHN